MNGTAILVLLGIPLIFVIVTYNSLVSLRNHIRDAWANIDTELKRRYDLIPNVVNTVKGYAQHERELLENVTRLRAECMATTGSPGQQAGPEIQLVDAMRNVMAVVESYPDLKANQHFLGLQGELINTEDRIQAARRFFIGNVRDYRNRRESFPSNIIAGMFGFGPEDFFDVDAIVREAPRVEL